MIIGVPKEIKDSEFGVGLVPAGVKVLTDLGHRVYVSGRRRRRKWNPQ